MNGYVAIGVNDLGRSRAFWTERLGLPVCGEWPGQRAVGEKEGFQVLLDGSGEIPVATAVELAFRVSPEAIRAAAERSRPARGPRDFGGPNGVEAAFRDPDGYLVTLYAGRS